MPNPLAFDNWTAHGWGIRVRTAHQLFGVISHIALLEQSRTYAWRGQCDASWPLSPALYRHLASSGETVAEERMRKAETEMLAEARRWGIGRDLGPSATDMHMLAVLQHHGLPTRLIDVTSNPMTALWFALGVPAEQPNDDTLSKPGVLFAIDVTDTDYYATFQHSGNQSMEQNQNPLSAMYNRALRSSKHAGNHAAIFRAFPALPDDRMRAQEGFFIGSSFPERHRVPGVIGFNPSGTKPGEDKLRKLLGDRQRGRPAKLPFCAIVIPAAVKAKIRDPLRRTYNRRRRFLFPDVDGFRDAWLREDLD